MMDESIRRYSPHEENLLKDLYDAAERLSAFNAAEGDYGREMYERRQARERYIKAVDAAEQAKLEFDLRGYLL
jgi:hypothetical protein